MVKHYCPAQKKKFSKNELPCIAGKECSAENCHTGAIFKALKPKKSAGIPIPPMPFLMR